MRKLRLVLAVISFSFLMIPATTTLTVHANETSSYGVGAGIIKGESGSTAEISYSEGGSQSSSGDGSGEAPVAGPSQEEIILRQYIELRDRLAERCSTLHQDCAFYRSIADDVESMQPKMAGGDAQASIESSVRAALLTMNLANPEVVIGPEPSKNKWDAVPVNFPIWLHLPGTGTQRDSVTHDGITISITATPSTAFTMGDGATVTCSTTKERPERLDEPKTPSPACGHTYRQPGDYTISATTTWNVNYQAGPVTGTLTTTTSSSRDITVNELANRVHG